MGHWRIGSATLFPRCSECGRLWRIGESSARNHVQGAAAAKCCGVLARRRCGIVPKLSRDMGNWCTGGAASCTRRSGCGRLWRIGVSAARHCVQGAAAAEGCGVLAHWRRGIISEAQRLRRSAAASGCGISACRQRGILSELS